MKKNTTDLREVFRQLCHSEKDLITHIKTKLSARSPRSYVYKNVPYTEAAVLVPLFFKNSQAHILFTRRTDVVEHHKGQVSFPGGNGMKVTGGCWKPPCGKAKRR